LSVWVSQCWATHYIACGYLLRQRRDGDAAGYCSSPGVQLTVVCISVVRAHADHSLSQSRGEGSGGRSDGATVGSTSYIKSYLLLGHMFPFPSIPLSFASIWAFLLAPQATPRVGQTTLKRPLSIARSLVAFLYSTSRPATCPCKKTKRLLPRFLRSTSPHGRVDGDHTPASLADSS